MLSNRLKFDLCDTLLRACFEDGGKRFIEDGILFFFQERRDSLGFSVYYVDIFQLDNFFVQQQEQETAKFS